VTTAKATQTGTDQPAEEKRFRILAAAERVCARRGVLAARMEEIAAEAGVSKGTLYRFFDAKDDLIVAMVIETYAAGQREVDETLPPDVEPGALLEILLEGLPRVLELQAARAPLHYAAWEVVGREPRLRARFYQYLRGFFVDREERMQAAIRMGQEAGRLRAGVDARAFADAILGLLSGFIFRSTFDPEAASPQRLAAAYRALVGATLLPASPPEGESDA
jgi:AcrR family transcriptional regulator